MKTTDLNAILARIKDKVHLSQIVGQDLVLQKKGREFVANCPFHYEKTASFFVNDEKGTFYCFGCGASGDVVEYLMRKNGINFEQTLEKLASLAGIQLPERNNYVAKSSEEQKILQKAVEFYKSALEESETAKEYCQERGLTKDIIDEFSIGHAPLHGDSLYKYLRSFGFKESELISSGLFSKIDNKITNRFKDRLMFPVFDRKGWPIAFGGRALQKEVMPKYLNSPESELFQKRETLYGYNIASRNACRDEQIVVVEGYIDVVMMHKNGFKTTVAAMGTAFSPEHLSKLWKYSSEPTICFDGDNAGYNAMVKTALLALKYITSERSLKFCLIPNAEDPDSFLKKNGGASMRKILDSSLHLVDFIWRHFEKGFGEIQAKTPERISKWKREIYTALDEILDADVKQLYKSEMKNRIFEHLRSFKKGGGRASAIFHVNKDDKMLLREAILLYIIIKRPSIISSVIESLSSVDFSEKGFARIKEVILEHGDNHDFRSMLGPDVLENLEKVAGSYCQFDGMSDIDVVGFWDEIFGISFFKKAQRCDVNVAREECANEWNSVAWERLRALKIYEILNRNKV